MYNTSKKSMLCHKELLQKCAAAIYIGKNDTAVQWAGIKSGSPAAQAILAAAAAACLHFPLRPLLPVS